MIISSSRSGIGFDRISTY